MNPLEKDILTDDHGYLTGAHNWGIRMYFYVNAGLNILNNFRNLFLAILAIYVTFKFTNPLWLPLMFIPSLIILCLVGWYTTHHVQKIFEWINIRFSTYYGIQQFNYTKAQYELLLQIKELLEKK